MADKILFCSHNFVRNISDSGDINARRRVHLAYRRAGVKIRDTTDRAGTNRSGQAGIYIIRLQLGESYSFRSSSTYISSLIATLINADNNGRMSSLNSFITYSNSITG